MRHVLMALILALLVGAAGIWLLQQNSGYLLISFGHTYVEMSFWLAVLLYVLSTAILIWLLLAMRWLLAAGGIRQWWNTRTQLRHAGKTIEGLLFFAEQNWSEASQLLSRSADRSPMPEISLLMAAQASQEHNDTERARQLLQQLKKNYPKYSHRADSALARLLITEQQFEKALNILQPLHNSRPNDALLLRLLSDIYVLQADWPALQGLLKDIKRCGTFDKQAVAMLELDIYAGLLAAFNPDTALSKSVQQKLLKQLWQQVPKALRKTPELIGLFAEALAKVDAREQILPLLTRALNNQWHENLLQRFAALETPTPEKQLSIAEKWLPDHREDPQLLLALGLICQRLGFLGKARDYLTYAVKLAPCPQTYLVLAEVQQAMGDTAASVRMYRLGLAARLEQADSSLQG